MRTDVCVEREFDLELLGPQSSRAVGVLFVDELDGDDGARSIERDGFANGGVGTTADGLADDSEGKRGGQRDCLRLLVGCKSVW